KLRYAAALIAAMRCTRCSARRLFHHDDGAAVVDQAVLLCLVVKQLQSCAALRRELTGDSILEVIRSKITGPVSRHRPALNDRVDAIEIVTTLPIENHRYGPQHGGI